MLGRHAGSERIGMESEDGGPVEGGWAGKGSGLNDLCTAPLQNCVDNQMLLKMFPMRGRLA